jgi:hypothetical protein
MSVWPTHRIIRTTIATIIITRTIRITKGDQAGRILSAAAAEECARVA